MSKRPQMSVVAAPLGRRTLNQRVGVRIPVKARRGICEQDTLKSTRGSQNKHNCVPPTSVKKI
jgi:hypothetical protein